MVTLRKFLEDLSFYGDVSRVSGKPDEYSISSFHGVEFAPPLQLIVDEARLCAYLEYGIPESEGVFPDCDEITGSYRLMLINIEEYLTQVGPLATRLEVTQKSLVVTRGKESRDSLDVGSLRPDELHWTTRRELEQ